MASAPHHGGDPLRLIAADHRAIADALEGMLSATYLSEGARAARLMRLRLALEAHEALEENAFYPAVVEIGAEGAALVQQAREAHRAIAAATVALEQSQPAPLSWASRAQRLADTLREHVEFEESRIFPAARAMGQARLARLGAALARLRQAYAQRPPGPLSSPSKAPLPPRHSRPVPRAVRR